MAGKSVQNTKKMRSLADSTENTPNELPMETQPELSLLIKSSKDDLGFQDKVQGSDVTPGSMKTEISSEMVTKLLETPLTICTSSGSLTPGLGNGVGALKIESPLSPRVGHFKMPLQPLQMSSSPYSLRSRLVSGTYLNRTRGLPLRAFGLSRGHSIDESKLSAVQDGGVRKDVEGCLVKADILPVAVVKNVHDGSSNVKGLSRSQSDSAVFVKKAADRISTDPLLVGDGSKHLLLPTISFGKHRDLKEISSDTLASVLKGEYSKKFDSFEIIDCRYPYEFAGGHIKGAVNFYTQKQFHEKYLKKPSLKSIQATRNILVFHCEFSAERAPNMCRFVRDFDRNLNKESYPALLYPEMYILHGGYKSFFENQPKYCSPSSYIPMDDREFSQECTFFETQSMNEVKKPVSSSQLASGVTRQRNRPRSAYRLLF